MTVFTPTYNRAHTLERLYESLVGQTVQDFEWLVIDDGSTDETEAVMTFLASRSPFPVRYVKQENQGKHVASNHAAREANGHVFWTVDSDDWLLPTSVETLLRHWRDVQHRVAFAAVTGLCQDPAGALVGDQFPAPVIDSNSLEMRYRHKVRGDKAGFTRTDIMRRHPFPEGDHSFIPEGVVWNAIAASYQTRYINEPVLVKDYRADGFTRGGTATSSRGGAMWTLDVLEKGTWYLVRSPIDLVKVGANYSRFALGAGDGRREILNASGDRLVRAIVAATFPLGWLLHRLRDKA